MRTNEEAAALVDSHLREAIRITRQQYKDDEFGALRWVFMQLTKHAGFTEDISYPIIDYLERVQFSQVIPPTDNEEVNVFFPECPECGARPGQAHDPTCLK